jgi:hypothetical protein
MKVKLIELRSSRLQLSATVTVRRSNSPPISLIDDLAEL